MINGSTPRQRDPVIRRTSLRATARLFANQAARICSASDDNPRMNQGEMGAPPPNKRPTDAFTIYALATEYRTQEPERAWDFYHKLTIKRHFLDNTQARIKGSRLSIISKLICVAYA